MLCSFCIINISCLIYTPHTLITRLSTRCITPVQIFLDDIDTVKIFDKYHCIKNCNLKIVMIMYTQQYDLELSTVPIFAQKGLNYKSPCVYRGTCTPS